MLYLSLLSFAQRVGNKIKFLKFVKNLTENMSYKYVEKKIYSSLYEAKKKSNLNEIGNNSQTIWLFWWQGINSMPPIVKSCVNSVEKHSNGKKVIIITKDNFFEYTNISENIIKKFEDGKITLTHLSDILRFNLLYNHGGLWIDATVYCTENLDDDYFGSLYTSGGYYGTDPKFVDGKWTGFLIGGNSKNDLFKFMNDFFESYWEQNDYLIQYFLIDYGLEYAYKNNIGGFMDYVDNKALNNNPHLFDLAPLLNESYDDDTFNLLKSNTKMFKLSYKMKFKDEDNTFYKKILSK